MTDLDLEKLGEQWRQQPDPAELEELRRTALAVSRRARRAQIVELAMSVIVAGLVILLVLSNPKADTMLVGGGAILLFLVNHRRQRRLRQVELQGLAGGTEDMLDQSIARVDASLRRGRFSLAAIGPGILLGIGVSHIVRINRDQEVLSQVISEPWLWTLIYALAVLSLAVMAFHLWRAIRRDRHELDRLQLLRQAYRKEASRSTQNGPGAPPDTSSN